VLFEALLLAEAGRLFSCDSRRAVVRWLFDIILGRMFMRIAKEAERSISVMIEKPCVFPPWKTRKTDR